MEHLSWQFPHPTLSTSSFVLNIFFLTLGNVRYVRKVLLLFCFLDNLIYLITTHPSNLRPNVFSFFLLQIRCQNISKRVLDSISVAMDVDSCNGRKKNIVSSNCLQNCILRTIQNNHMQPVEVLDDHIFLGYWYSETLALQWMLLRCFTQITGNQDQGQMIQPLS